MYQISEFSCSLILVSASAPKTPYQSGPIYLYNKFTKRFSLDCCFSLLLSF